MAMIFHFIECLKCLGMKIRMKNIFASSTVIDHSPFLNIVHLKKVLHDKDYVNKLKIDLKKKCVEIRNDLANERIDALLCIIWDEIGVVMEEEALYPFRNAMLVGFVDEQTTIYEEVIDKFCDYLKASRRRGFHVCKESINELVWPVLLMEAFMKHGGKGTSHSSASDEMLMKKLSVILKVSADKIQKKKRQDEAEMI